MKILKLPNSQVKKDSVFHLLIANINRFRIPKVDSVKLLQKSNKLLFILMAIVFVGLPSGFTNANFYIESAVTGNTFSTTCWLAPTTPVLNQLPDNALIHKGNPWLSNPLLKWDVSISSCETANLEYQVIISTDAQMSNIIESSNWLSTNEFVTTVSAEGEYFWQVLVRDIAHTATPQIKSEVRRFSIDLSDLQTPAALGWNTQEDSASSAELPVDLSCGANTTHGNSNNLISVVWSGITGNNLTYQYQVLKPDSSEFSLNLAQSTSSDFFSLGEFPSIEGTWKTRVRAFEDDNLNQIPDGFERVSEYSDFCELHVAERVAVQTVVLNEILPDPQGPDNLPIPFGEWIELYNRSDVPIDINGWMLTADDTSSYPLVISTDNTFLDLPFGQGSTVIPPQGFLVTYRSANSNFDLKNIPEGAIDSETVKLFNAKKTLQDSTRYSSTRENKSITRIPDGFDNWVDPVPSPGKPNTEDDSMLQPFGLIAQQDLNHAVVAISQAHQYQSADLIITYLREINGNKISEAVFKKVKITDLLQVIPDIYFGTVSNGNLNPHQQISDVRLELTLHSNLYPDKTLNVLMHDQWRKQ